MRSLIAVMCLVTVACSDAPSGGGKQPEPVGEEQPAESVRDEIELVNDEVSEPDACHFVVAAAIGWFCNGDPCPQPKPKPGVVVATVVCDSAANIAALDIDLSADACPLTAEALETAAAECEGHDIPETALSCALRALDSEQFMCCFEGTSLLLYPEYCD